MAAYVYDFGVQGQRTIQALQTTRAPQPIAQQSSVSSDAITPEPAAGSSFNESVPSSKPATSHRASLGILGSDWREDEAKGVEIVTVIEGSTADLAGLRKGDVITDINGVRVGSSQQLSSVLSAIEPGTKISISYLYKSNIGWMPKSALAILSREQ
jgi:S1-C subfamily serine protease